MNYTEEQQKRIDELVRQILEHPPDRIVPGEAIDPLDKPIPKENP
jgi:Flp pilus assembly CpaF family ATPase